MYVFQGKRSLLWLLAIVILGAVLYIPIGPPEETTPIMTVEALNLNDYSAGNPEKNLRLLFIHHSCGGQWLAPVGSEDVGEDCIYTTAANGGGLRERLSEAGYEVHEASYNSRVGDKTDIFDWPDKFRNQMEEILSCDLQDSFYSDSTRNDIVMFKSCYPQNKFVGRGQAPGNEDGPELTVENAKAAYRALLPEFQKHPNTLFVAVTAPPLAPVRSSTRLYKVIAKKILGRRDPIVVSGPLARQFNNWLKDPQSGWLSNYDGTNVVVFDYYDILTDRGASNFSRYPTGPEKTDNHPSSEGNQKAAEAFVPFLNRAVHRSGILESSA